MSLASPCLRPVRPARLARPVKTAPAPRRRVSFTHSLLPMTFLTVLAAAVLLCAPTSDLCSADVAPAPAPAPDATAQAVSPAPTDYTQLFEFRIDRPGLSRLELIAFLDHALPLVRADAIDVLTMKFACADTLNSIDTTRPIRMAIYAPKQLFQLHPDDHPRDLSALRPVLVRTIPVNSAKAFLAQLQENVDEVKSLPDGSYCITPGAGITPIYLKFATGKFQTTAIVSSQPVGLAVGAAALQAATDRAPPDPAAVPATEDQPAPPLPTAVIEIHPAQFLHAAGLDQPDARKQFTELLRILWRRRLKDRPEPPPDAPRFRLGDDPDAIDTLLPTLTDLAADIDTAALELHVDKDQVRFHFRLQAVPGSALAQQIAALPALDPVPLQVLSKVAPTLLSNGATDPVYQRLLPALLALYPAAFRRDLEDITRLFAAKGVVLGRSCLGFDAAEHFEGAAEYRFPAGTDPLALLQTFSARFKDMLAALPHPPAPPPPPAPAQGPPAAAAASFQLSAPREEDGWKIFTATLHLPARENPAGADFPAVLMVKATRVVIGLGPDREHALANAREFARFDPATTAASAAAAQVAKIKTATFDPDFQAVLDGLLKPTRPVLAVVFQPAPLLMHTVTQNIGDKPLEETLRKSIGTAHPLLLVVRANGNRIDGELRYEADGIKKFGVFVLAMRDFYLGRTVPPGPQGPPGGPDDQF
ncbi:MAG: hypothetical protein ACREJ2_02135 [Planctomycetota bacterium]